MKLKEKIFSKILSKSNSYHFYKNYYEKNQKKKIVKWEDIFYRISKNDEVFNITMQSIQENFSKKNVMKYCPVCGYKTPIFIAGGVKYRKNAMCPNCNSLERHRFLSFFINHKLNIKEKNIKLLHFAPEKSFYDIFENLENIEYYTGDIEKSYYVKEIIDIQNIQYPDNFFNLIICNHVLEHVPDDKKAMKELYRIIQPVSEDNGVIIMVPIDFNSQTTLEKEEYNTPELREKYYGQHDHVRMYGMDFQDKLEEVGFNVEVFDCNSPFFKNSKKYGFNNDDVIYYCTKK